MLPYVSEEVWSWWRDGSIHRAEWPNADALRVEGGDPLVYGVAADVLADVRKVKSTQKVSLASPVERVHVIDTAERLAALEAARRDVSDAGRIARLEVEAGTVACVRVELASVPES